LQASSRPIGRANALQARKHKRGGSERGLVFFHSSRRHSSLAARPPPTVTITRDMGHTPDTRRDETRYGDNGEDLGKDGVLAFEGYEPPDHPAPECYAVHHKVIHDPACLGLFYSSRACRPISYLRRMHTEPHKSQRRLDLNQ
jgi:hypothetical protein